ncbi:MAG: hypothetical protein U5L45_27135 [Saprospiraceae bacterium]|nr:hypothetical protein [Saprospiraceae bacterium]
MLDLAGCWTLSDESGAHVIDFDLPGDGISALVKAGVIPEPYWGRNEYDCRWVSERDWVARRVFTHDGSGAELVVDGLDTVAEVRLNGVIVLSAANVHRRWRVDVSSALRVGENAVEILFRSPVLRGACPGSTNAVSNPLSAGERSDCLQQHAAQTAMRFRLGLEHCAGHLRGLRVFSA